MNSYILDAILSVSAVLPTKITYKATEPLSVFRQHKVSPNWNE